MNPSQHTAAERRAYLCSLFENGNHHAPWQPRIPILQQHLMQLLPQLNACHNPAERVREYLAEVSDEAVLNLFYSARIAAENDQFRCYGALPHLGVAGEFDFPAAVMNWEWSEIYELETALRAYNDFTPATDPDGLHEFGCFPMKHLIYELRFCFRIEYFSLTGEFGANPFTERVYRVLKLRECAG